MTWKDIVGYPSAAALGYIHGGVYGAKNAINAYKLLSKNKQSMAPVKRKNHGNHRRGSKRVRTQSTIGSSGSLSLYPRRGSVSSSLSVRSSSTRAGSQRMMRQTGVGSRAPYVSRTRFTKSVSFAHKKKTQKLPKGFAKKVALALKKNAPKGIYTEVVQDTIFNGTDNVQNPQAIPYVLTTTIGAITTEGLLFDPTQVLYAASALFNGFGSVAKAKNPTAAGLFDYENIVIDVLSASADIVMHNNSQRTYILDIYDCAVKIPGNYPNVRTDWVSAMSQDAVAGINPFSTNPTNMYQSPNMSPQFKQYYKTGVEHIVLEPGQVHTVTVPGPKMMKYDFAKFWKEGVFINQQKMVRKPLIIAKLDVIGARTAISTPSTTGRLKEVGISGVNGLLIETKVNYKLSMPEQTGFIYPASTAAGLKQPLTFRHMAYAIINFNDPQDEGDVEVRIDEEQPQTQGLGLSGAPL